MGPPRSAEPAAERREGLLPVVGESSRALVEILGLFARQEETVLISGPTGAGKSRLAEWCHAQSRRRAEPFQVLDLLSVPEEMQMAEIFGWRRGAFTGAVHDQEGCVARAENGTLFIDEIDKLSLRAQLGLLQLFETRRYRVLGDTGRQRAANVRMIVATNADLRKEVDEGRFREDLYFRIHVLPVRLPPLSERRDEVVPWARFMLSRLDRERRAGGEARFSPQSEAVLDSASWPGNLRQLDNVIRRAYVLATPADPGAGDLQIGARHVESALQLEHPGAPSAGVLQVFRRAAAELFEHAVRCHTRGLTFDLDHADALRGLVIEAGVRRLGDVREVYRLLGQESVVRSRNHHREYRRELVKVERLEEELGKVARGGGEE